MSARTTVGRNAGFVLAGLVLALLLAGVVSNFAAGTPDGLDAAGVRGCTTDAAGEITGGSCIAQGARDHELGDSPLADYGFSAVDAGPLSTGLAGVTGVLLTFTLAGGLFWLSRRRGPGPDPAAGDSPASDVAAAAGGSPAPDAAPGGRPGTGGTTTAQTVVARRAGRE